MPYCARCGVEVDAEAEACPLCAAAIPVFDDDEPVGGLGAPPPVGYPVPPDDLEPLSPRQVRMAVWAVLSSALLVAAVVVLGVDLARHGGRMAYSGYALASFGLVWTLSTSAIFLFRRPWLVVLVDLVPVLGFLATVDLLDGGHDWFLPLGLPIAGATLLALQVSAVLWTVWKDRGANQVAVLLLLLALAGLAVDLAVSAGLGTPGLSWSLVVLSVVVLLAALLFLHHYVLRRLPRLRRIFHV